MTSARYPTRPAEITSWAAETGRSPNDARARFAQYAVLCAIGSVPNLTNSLVFKGGNALDFVWLPNRSTVDLDFSLDPNLSGSLDEIEMLRSMLIQGLSTIATRFNCHFNLHRLRQNPPGANRHFFTYQANIGYVLPDQVALLRNIEQGASNPQIVQVDVSVNELICEDRMTAIDSALRLRVATPADIVAEKLRAILQQASRNRHRAQDVLDIAGVVENDPNQDPAKVSTFLLAKAAARSVTVSKAAFREAETVARSNTDYAALERTTSVRFIPFDDALAILLAFVDRLDIPD